MTQNIPIEEWRDNIGKVGQMDTPDLGVLRFTILDEIRFPQSTFPTKIIHFQKVQFDNGQIEFRLCYYMNRDGRWAFGRFTTMLPANDFRFITDEAKKKGWI